MFNSIRYSIYVKLANLICGRTGQEYCSYDHKAADIKRKMED